MAREADIGAIVRLNGPVQRLHAELYPGIFKAQADDALVHKFFAGLIAADEHVIGIYEGPEGPAGYIWLEEHPREETPFTKAVRSLYIHHISVLEGARRRGVGSALMRWANERAESLRIFEIGVDHWADNKAAHRFFSRHEFKDVRIIMRAQLTPDAGGLRLEQLQHGAARRDTKES